MTSYVSNLSVIAILAPFVMAFIIGLMGDRFLKGKKVFAVLATLTSLVCVSMLIIPIMVDGKIITYWMGNWVPEKFWAIGIGLEIDALGLFVGLIIAVTCFLSSIYTIRYMDKDTGLEKYYALFLLLTGSMLGYVFTGDLFNMYVMLEIMTFAAVGLTAFRNHLYKSVEAAFKYIVIGSIGSSFVLLGTCLLYSQLHTLNLAQIAAMLHGSSYTPVTILALALMLSGYAVKAFLVPCHTWPPDAHMAAPTSISMLLSGVMSKTGIYAIIRILYMLYQTMGLTHMEFLIVFWGTVTMIVGVSMALIQKDFKRMLAFSSVSQIGYIAVALGIGLAINSKVAVIGIMGGLYHMLNHAAFKCLLFLCAGAVLYRAGTTDMSKLGGLSKKMPHTTILFFIGAASISGIPPFGGFVSKWLIYQGTFEAGYAPVTIIALLVSVVTLAYFVKIGQLVFFGRLPEEYKDVQEVPITMRIPMMILAVICILAGLIPNLVSKYLIESAAYSIYNIGDYINVMFGKGYAESIFKEKIKIPNMDYTLAGYWKPEAWLVLFFILLIALILIFSFNIKKGINKLPESCDSKYDNFTGGEKEAFNKPSANDLFWGLNYQLKGYFNKLSNAHSGVVNDYVLWVVVCLAVVSIYLFIFM